MCIRDREYISRMDADDIMSPIKIASLLSACDNKNSISTGLVTYFSDAVLGQGYKKYADWLNTNLQTENPFLEIYKECVVPSPCWMMHREALDSIGAFDENRYPEDYDLTFRMRNGGLELKLVDKILHHWRDYPERSSRTDENYACLLYTSPSPRDRG